MEQQVDFESKTDNPNVPGVMDISPEDLMNHKDNVLMVDVRRPDEFEGELGHIPGAQHLVLDQLPQRISELDSTKTIVFVCRSGGRSGQATQFAQQNGFKSVFNLKGGMLLWNEKNLPTEK